MSLVKRVPVYQAPMGTDLCKGTFSGAGKGSLKQSAPSYQAASGKCLLGKVKVGKKSAESKSRSMKDVQRVKQKAGLTNKGYGI